MTFELHDIDARPRLMSELYYRGVSFECDRLLLSSIVISTQRNAFTVSTTSLSRHASPQFHRPVKALPEQNPHFCNPPPVCQVCSTNDAGC